MTGKSPSIRPEQLIAARTTAHVENILASPSVVDPNDYQLDYGNKVKGKWRKGHLHWLPVWLERGNSGRIKLAGEPL